MSLHSIRLLSNDLPLRKGWLLRSKLEAERSPYQTSEIYNGESDILHEA